MIDAAIVTAIRARLTSALAPPRERMCPIQVDGHAAGWVDSPRAARLAAFDDVFRVGPDGIRFLPQLADEPSRTRAVDRIVRTLAAENALTAWRDERYAVAPDFGLPPWFLLERAAARYFGVRTFAAHVNGLVDAGGAPRMWFARRSPVKSIDPDLLDNLVGGGIAAGATIAGTVMKESQEEAGIGADLAATARLVGTVEICRLQPDGLQRETLFVHDLALPRDFWPAGQDGEAVEHILVDFDAAARLIANTSGRDVVTVDASLVALDCLLRHRAIAAAPPERAALEALRRPAPTQFD
jgi:8-oxo-dGTP pyrophosphatase MutT (NUDIX family)